jgi:hypothetical protein
VHFNLNYIFSVLVAIVNEKYGKNKPALKIYITPEDNKKVINTGTCDIFMTSALCTNDYIAEPNSGSTAWEAC